MNRRLGRRAWLGATLLGGAGWAWHRLLASTAQPTHAAAPTFHNLADLITHNAPGHLIFRGTRSVEGQVVRWFDDASDYTHVGVLVPDPTGRLNDVVHATPDGNAVRQEPLSTFLQHPGTFVAGSFGWQLPNGEAASALANQVQRWLGTPFDGDFNSDDSARLYCTELVWHAAQGLGWVAAPALHTLVTPLGVKQVITISHLLQRLPLRPTWVGRAA